eukprot:283792-Pelagomonas_calceolata.AAC.2
MACLLTWRGSRKAGTRDLPVGMKLFILPTYGLPAYLARKHLYVADGMGIWGWKRQQMGSYF